MVTGAALATVNRLPVLQQLQHPIEADVTVNDAFRPVSRFFDRITRPEQLLTALPAAMRVLTDQDEIAAGGVIYSGATLADGVAQAGIKAPAAWAERTRRLTADWSAVRAAAIDPDRAFDPPADQDIGRACHLEFGLVQVAAGLGARASRVTIAAELRAALSSDTTASLRTEYETDLASQQWYG
jgi:TPP-dependent trihydroxycyclohexane-1,2-dione (THcHDO) dehydratase